VPAVLRSEHVRDAPSRQQHARDGDDGNDGGDGGVRVQHKDEQPRKRAKT
jgi:hypothetical protein